MTKIDSSQIQWRVPWWSVPPEHDTGTVAKLHREMPDGHVFFGRTVQTVGRRQDCDDVLFYTTRVAAPLEWSELSHQNFQANRKRSALILFSQPTARAATEVIHLAICAALSSLG